MAEGIAADLLADTGIFVASAGVAAPHQQIIVHSSAALKPHMPYVSASFGVPHCEGSATALLRVLLVLSPSCRHMPAVAKASVK